MKLKNLVFLAVLTSGMLVSCDKNEDEIILANEENNSVAKNQVLIYGGANFDAGSHTLEWSGDPEIAQATYVSNDYNFSTPIAKFERGAYSNSLSITSIDTVSWEIEVLSTGELCTLRVQNKLPQELTFTLDGSSFSEIAEIQMNSLQYDLTRILPELDNEDIEIHALHWGWVAAVIIGRAIDGVLDHCGGVVQVGAANCVAAGGLPQTGFCSVDCCPQSGC